MFNPVGGVGEGLRVPSGEVEEALTSNRLNTPEKRHVLEAVTAYEGRSARRALFETQRSEQDRANFETARR